MLEPVLRLINYLAPRMERFCSSHGAAVDDGAVLEFLQKATVVGVLPVPHPIMMKRYQANEYTHLWFTTFLWGNIFLRNQGANVWCWDEWGWRASGWCARLLVNDHFPSHTHTPHPHRLCTLGFTHHPTLQHCLRCQVATATAPTSFFTKTMIASLNVHLFALFSRAIQP